MTPTLTKIKLEVYHFVDGKRVDGVHDKIVNASSIRGDASNIQGNASSIRGDVSNIRGDASNIRGNVSDISGYVSDISGDVSGIRGDASGISGNLDECGITDADRAKGIKVEDLIKPEKPVK